MSAPLETCTKEEQLSVILFFFNSEGVKPIEIHRRMNQYGDACLSLQQVYEWTRKFMNGISSVTDSPRPGQAHRVVTPEAIAEVEAIVKENRRVTVNEIAAHPDMSHGSAHHIVHDKKYIYLGFSFDSLSYKQPTGCNNNNFINNFNQLNMFWAIISPILRSTSLCLQLVV